MNGTTINDKQVLILVLMEDTLRALQSKHKDLER